MVKVTPFPRAASGRHRPTHTRPPPWRSPDGNCRNFSRAQCLVYESRIQNNTSLRAVDRLGGIAGARVRFCVGMEMVAALIQDIARS